MSHLTTKSALENKEIRMRESSLLSVLLIAKPILKYLPRSLGLRSLRRVFLTSPFAVIPLIWYLGEWVIMGGAFALVVISGLVLYNPDLFVLVVFPTLTTIFSNSVAHTLLSAVGIEYVEPQSWFSYILSL